jgi:hypothetical protein
VLVGTTDDAQPTFSGSLGALLGSGEQLANYDIFNGGGYTRLGTAGVDGSKWSYTHSAALPDGNHSWRAVIEATTATTITDGRVISDAYSFIVDATL